MKTKAERMNERAQRALPGCVLTHPGRWKHENGYVLSVDSDGYWTARAPDNTYHCHAITPDEAVEAVRAEFEPVVAEPEQEE